MSPLTDDPRDPRLSHGTDSTPTPQAEVYLVLSEEERAKGLALCETYARNPKFYGATYCTTCRMHKPVSEFTWVEDGEVVGS
jgi:hypothetical protein